MKPRLMPWIPVVGWLIVIHNGFFNCIREEQFWYSPAEYWLSAVWQIITFSGFLVGLFYLALV